jgi:hypothetical protein
MSKLYSDLPVAEKEINHAAQWQQIKTLFEIKDEQEVLDFLNQYSFLYSYVLEARSILAKLFDDADFFLTVVYYPPEPKGNEELVIYFATSLGPEKGGKILNKFDEDWWIDAMPETKLKLNIVMEFK